MPQRTAKYMPDPVLSPAVLRAAIKERGLSLVQAAERIGVPPAYLRKILAGETFPVAPEFAVVAAYALGEGQPLDPRIFPGYGAWAEANPSAAMVVEHLAKGMVGRYRLEAGRSRKIGRKSARQRLFERFRESGIIGQDEYWNGVLRGAEPFPRDPKKLEAIAAVLDIDARKFAEYPRLAPPPERDETQLFARLVEDLAHAVSTVPGNDGPNPSTLRLLTRRLLDAGALEPPQAVRPILTSIREGWRVRDLARLAGVDFDTLIRLLLGLTKPDDDRKRAVVQRVRKVLSKHPEPTFWIKPPRKRAQNARPHTPAEPESRSSPSEQT